MHISRHMTDFPLQGNITFSICSVSVVGIRKFSHVYRRGYGPYISERPFRDSVVAAGEAAFVIGGVAQGKFVQTKGGGGNREKSRRLR